MPSVPWVWFILSGSIIVSSDGVGFETRSLEILPCFLRTSSNLHAFEDRSAAGRLVIARGQLSHLQRRLLVSSAPYRRKTGLP